MKIHSFLLVFLSIEAIFNNLISKEENDILRFLEEVKQSSTDNSTEDKTEEDQITVKDGYKIKCFWFGKGFDVFDLSPLENKLKDE